MGESREISEKDDYNGVITPDFGEKTCIPEHKKDFGAPRSCSDFDSRAIKHGATARNDGGKGHYLPLYVFLLFVPCRSTVISSGGKRRGDYNHKNRM